MFKSLLVANRGEIACRIIHSARRLAIRTIAVYSDADRDAPHVAMADDAQRLGPAAAADSYLNVAAVLDAARASGAEAVHPGYGFLSENAEFAVAVAEAGMTFVGPPPAAIRAMGAKDEARRLMAAAGVPTVPGYDGEDDCDETLAREADRIGYPVVLKARSGGGGKGIRVVDGPADLTAAAAACRREAKAAFGDGRLILERFLARPRHVEVQVFADDHGNCVHLFERDCSLQRRHQKVIEEAPAPGLSDDLRGRMGETAVAAARAVDYRGAGTVEFLLDGEGAFHFLEMNTRLQVEHPVTELVTNLDLVDWQLRVAAGEPLPKTQDEIRLRYHAVEARLYAEDPAAGFLPSIGCLTRLRLPGGAGVRVDSGVAEGGRITTHYDPMVAKIIARGDDRDQAIDRLRRAVAATQVAGVETNLEFLADLLDDTDFRAGAVHTGLVDGVLAGWRPAGERGADGRTRAVAALAVVRHGRQLASARAARSGDRASPWARADAWRLNAAAVESICLWQAGEPAEVVLAADGDGFRTTIDGVEARLAGDLDPSGDLTAEIDGVPLSAGVAIGDGVLTLFVDGRRHRFGLAANEADGAAGEGAAGDVRAPLPGRVVAIEVSPGDSVAAGQVLVVMEAMKMEHPLRAAADGRVVDVLTAVGQQVVDGAILIQLRGLDELTGK